MNKTIETIAPRLTELMIRKIETLTEEWHQPWVADTSGLPRNLRGTPYRAGNILLLAMLTELEAFRAPVFMTFKQAKENGLSIRPGQSAFPIYFWKMYIRHKETRKQIDMEVYRQLSTTEKLQYDLRPILRYYTVFNIDQTDMAETDPARYAELTKTAEPEDRSDDFVCAGIDALLEAEGWLCPIELEYSKKAFYSRMYDKIVCPLRRQFPSGVAFYDTLLHEVAHSTGHSARLNRPAHLIIGDSAYAREELVAELTSALCGAILGFSVAPRAENAAYLKHWLTQLKEEPTYLFDILVDVNKAARMIIDRIEPDTRREPYAAAA